MYNSIRNQISLVLCFQFPELSANGVPFNKCTHTRNGQPVSLITDKNRQEASRRKIYPDKKEKYTDKKGNIPTRRKNNNKNYNYRYFNK